MRWLLITGLVILVFLLLLLGGWAWVLAGSDPAGNVLAEYFPWPVVCTTRGCVSSTRWLKEEKIQQTFAEKTGQEIPTAADALNTLARQHLTHYAQLRQNVTLADAERYRTEILNVSQENQIKDTTGLILDDYDNYVLLPYLEQESLRQQRSAETPDDLYQQLAKERLVVVLPFHLKWDRQEGRVIQRVQ
ncbi:MAG: hypothetical protein U1C49_03280 [Candidatus Andersenbacteria bacterium]|nr:hypothetical protein [bacterium]MDZ4225847.1 hypothetical protein [Candidatus Andersenbacteria bacterium]